jgi:hypothetical protein
MTIPALIMGEDGSNWNYHYLNYLLLGFSRDTEMNPIQRSQFLKMPWNLTFSENNCI